MSRIESNCHLFAHVEPLVFVIGVWPSIRYELHIAASDSSNRVRGLDDLSNTSVGEAVLVCGCQGSLALFGAQRSLDISVHRSDATWTGHLECEGGVVWYCIKESESFASEQCLIAALKRSDVES